MAGSGGDSRSNGAGDERRRWEDERVALEMAAAALERRTGGAGRRWRRSLLDEDEDEGNCLDPGRLCAYIGADPLAPVRGWNRC